MSNKNIRFFSFIFFFVLLFSACGGKDKQGVLLFPAIVAIDVNSNRIFVVDNQLNGLNLIDVDSNEPRLFDKNKPLLNEEDPPLLPDFPSNAVVSSIAEGTSRLFIIGNGGAPSNQIVVLDFDDTNLLRPATFSPITVPGLAGDALVGLALDSIHQRVFVSNSSTGQLHVYDVLSGAEVAGSPIAIAGIPGRMNFDRDSGLLVLSNAADTRVTFIDSADLAAIPQALDVGILSRDAALAGNVNGSVLFVSGAQQNTARAFKLDLNNLANSTALFALNPPLPGASIPDPNFVPGSINFVKAARLSDGRVSGFYTLSTGDLLILSAAPDLSSVSPAIAQVGNLTGEGLDVLFDADGNAMTVYFASPGAGTLSLVDPLTQVFKGQVL